MTETEAREKIKWFDANYEDYYMDLSDIEALLEAAKEMVSVLDEERRHHEKI
jgi:hypothetical protein